MSIFSLILLATAVSIDGFWGGFSFGLRRIKIPFISLLIIASWSIICTMIVMILGYNLKEHISMEVAKYIGAGLLLILGLLTLREGFKQRKEVDGDKEKLNVEFRSLFKVLNNPILADIDKQNDVKPLEGTLLGIAVAMDASIAAFTVSLLGFNPYITPFLFGLTHFLLIGTGNYIARKNVVFNIGEKFSLLPGLILVFLSILRLI